MGAARTFPCTRDDVDYYWKFQEGMQARMRTDDGEHFEWHDVTVASSQCMFRRTAVHSVPLRFREYPVITRDLVHLEEDFGEGGLEVEPLACVRRSVCGMLYSDDAGIVFKSTGDLASMTVVVTVFDSAGLTVPETETETTLLRTLNKILPAPPLVVDTVVRGIYTDDEFSVSGRGLINASADILPEIKDGSDSRGHATIVLSLSRTIWKMLRSH